jgi:predicted Zn-dependent protease
VEPLRVWVGDGAHIESWDPTYPQRVREAFSAWETVGIPVRFTFVLDSTDADIHVGWVNQFDAPISGKTLWSRDRHWWIVGASITLALHHNGGEALDGSAVHAIALHEAGHLLGLDHTADPANIMTPKLRVRELSDADRATIRLLYTLPPGSVK